MLNEQRLTELCQIWDKYYRNENQTVISISNEGIKLETKEFLETFEKYEVVKDQKISVYEKIKRYEVSYFGVKFFTVFIELW